MSVPLRALEHRALLALDAWREGRQPALAERLTRWPPAVDGARLLAGQANAARGRELLWVVGGGRRAPSDPLGLARSWLAESAGHFEGLAPETEAVPLEDGTTPLVAVAVRTSRAPFTLRPRGARPGEVPWFDFQRRALRSATRLDLVRLVTPLGELPQFEFLEAELAFFRNLQPRSRTTYRWTLDASVYVLPRSADRLILPFHKLRSEVAIGGWKGRAAELHLTADRQSPALRVTESALLADGLGRFFLYASGSTDVESLAWDEPARFTAEFLPAGAELCALAEGHLQRETVLEANQMARWKSA